MLQIKCPKCKNRMLCNPKGVELSKKVKRCVYCGRSFKVLGNILKKI